MTTIIDGKAVAEEVVAKVKAAAARLHAEAGISPGLAVVIVGEDPASQVYVGAKSKRAKECGFHSVQHSLPEMTSEDEVLALVRKLNADPQIHGILVQLPLPAHIDTGRIIQTIAPHKDVDGFHFENVGRLGAGELATAFVPCTPAGSMILLSQDLWQGSVRPQCRRRWPLQHCRQAHGEPSARRQCDGDYRPQPHEGSA